MTFQEFVCTGRKRAIHPVTWRAFLRSVKANTLNFEFLADQFVQIDAASDHIAPRQSRRAVMNLQRAAKFIENFQRSGDTHPAPARDARQNCVPAKRKDDRFPLHP